VIVGIGHRSCIMLIVVGCLAALAACAGGRVTDGVYRDAGNRYTLRLPAGAWLPQPLEGAVVAFRAPSLRAGLGLAVECERPEPGELRHVARHLFWGLTNRQIRESGPVSLRGAVGRRSRLVGRLDGQRVEAEGVTVRHGGCLYDFVYVAPPEAFERGRADFEAFLAGFTPLAGP